MAPVSMVQLPQRLVCWSDQRTDAGWSSPPKWRLDRASARAHQVVIAGRRAPPQAPGHALDPFRLFLG